MTPNNLALALAQKTADAYSYDRFRSWNSVARLLLGRGYTMREAEAIMRSKWMRWAADNATASYGKIPARVIIEYMDGMIDRWGTAWFQRELREIVVGTFPNEASYTFTTHTGTCSRGCGDKFYVSQETIDEMKQNEPTFTLEEIIGSLDFCLECVSGEKFDGEKKGLN